MRNLLLILLLSLAANVYGGNISKKYNISFQQDDFSFTYDANGYLSITSATRYVYPEANEPGLPVICYDITFDGQYSYVSSDVKYEKKLIMSNIIVQQSPVPAITDGNTEKSHTNGIRYSDRIYPASNFIYSTQSRWSDFSVFSFLVCPFIYDAEKKNLYIIESLTIDVTASQDTPMLGKIKFGRIPSKIRKAYDKNAENTLSNITTKPTVDNNSVDANIEYVIITADSLRHAFEPLLNWKRTKGLKSKIITLEEIYSTYPGLTNSARLKKCLYDLYTNKGLIYALLGGDDKIVPVQGCYCKVYKGNYSYYIDESIPSDIFYSCFDGDFEWDGNGNGIYGEIDDNINFTQYIYVTRVPIRNSTDISSYISKLLNYEQNPDWSNRMLTCGTKLWRMIKNSTQSDAEAKGNNLYSNYIKPFWAGERIRFYDTATDFSDGENYNLKNSNLTDQLSKGYDFVDMMTHGTQTAWSMEEGPSYSSYYGKAQTNIRSTIVTTMACHTNAFDTSSYPGGSDPCLSEGLIRKPLSGVIAYLGSSRYGWGYGGDDDNGGSAELGVSLQYESYFYRYLFNKTIENLNYGTLVSLAKNACIANCNIYGSYRWLQLALNPIGDPEMSIFIEQPKKFTDIQFKQTSGELTIKTGVDRCNICVSSASDYGETYHKLYGLTNQITIHQFPLSYCVCITKSGYIPLIYYLSYESGSNKWIIQNQKLSGANTYTFDNVEIGSNITKALPEGHVEVQAGITEINANTVTLRPGFSVNKGAEFKINNK